MNNNGAYELEGIVWHQTSPRLMLKILELWPDKSVPVIDLGCGMNYYCSVLEYAGYKAFGVDGVMLKGVDIQIDITKTDFREGTLRQSMDSWLYKKGDKVNALSFETGEHLPPELSGNYLDNLTSFGGDVIMSWAVPGQAGIGHVNCKPNEWVMEQMENRGMKFDPAKTVELRQAVQDCPCSWFKNTLMYYSR